LKKRKDRGFRMRKEDRRNGRKGEKGSDKLLKQTDVEGPREGRKRRKYAKKIKLSLQEILTHTVQRKKIHKNVLEYCFHNFFLVLYTFYYIV
jgi:hypothetical protein